jgi:DNA-binding transcriptional regulator YhcF (GntR family)
MNDYVKAVMNDQIDIINDFIEDMRSLEITDDEIIEIVKEVLAGEYQ